ncbi:hypothetical protein Hanom_Chr08g00689921 [Helianthus anomalus]
MFLTMLLHITQLNNQHQVRNKYEVRNLKTIDCIESILPEIYTSTKIYSYGRWKEKLFKEIEIEAAWDCLFNSK